MNYTEFKALRDSLNLTLKTLGRLVDEPSIDIVHSWESGEQIIPAHVIAFISKISTEFQLVLQAAIKSIQEAKQSKVNLIRYLNDADFQFANPELFNIFLSNEVYGALLQRISNESIKLVFQAGVVNFDRESYLVWLNENDLCNCTLHLSEWVSTAKYTVTLGQIELMEKDVVDINETIFELKKILLHQIKFTSQAIIVANIEASQSALLHSILELVDGALDSFKQNKLILSANAARALFERQLILFKLYTLIKRIIKESRNQNHITELKKLMFGARGEFKMEESFNILTILEKQIKSVYPNSKMKELYDELSNLVHPNFNGVFDAYVELDIENLTIKLGCHDKGNIGLTILNAIKLATDLTKFYYEQLRVLLQKHRSELIDKFNNIKSSTVEIL